MKILVTGAAGFIGTNLIRKLAEGGHSIVTVDIDQVTDPATLGMLTKHWISGVIIKHWVLDIVKDRDSLKLAFGNTKPDVVIHLAAYAGVRQSLEKRSQYVRNNVMGMTHVLDLCKEYNVKRLIYASSSSVYGMTDGKPSKETDPTNPISVYAATKKMCEVLAETYSRLYSMDIIGLRFFTVYGPHGRQDMAIHKFTDAIYKETRIELNASLNASRSFTYVDDVVNSIVYLLLLKPNLSHEVLNVGSEDAYSLQELIKLIEKHLGKKAMPFNHPPPVLGDVPHTRANCDRLFHYTKYRPTTTLNEGISKFVEWYLANKGGMGVGG